MTSVLVNAENRAHALIALAGHSRPQVVPSNRQLDDWNVYAPATVARCAYLLESIVALKHREIDAGVLFRSMVDHLLTFAWIAAEPASRMRRVLASEYRKRLDADRQASLVDGSPLISPELAAEFESYIQRVGSLAPDARAMAEQADEHWSAIMPELELRGRYGFAGMYLTCFRQFSVYAHPTTAGLAPFVANAEGGLAIGRPLTKSPGQCVSGATIAFSLQLWVASSALGWPDKEAIDAIHATFPAAR